MGPFARWAKMDSPVKPANDAGGVHRSLTQPQAGAAAVLVDELDARRAESVEDRLAVARDRLALAKLELSDRADADAGGTGEFLLGPTQKGARGLALIG